jgi:ubiquinone/menaquinone biosynthesis C-methylase UbiE
MMKQQKENTIEFWNQMFKEVEPMTIDRKDVKIESTLDHYLKLLGDSCKSILDVGCGLGTCLMNSLCLGEKMEKGIGFDSSEHAISFAKETSRLSGFDALTYVAQDESFLETLDDESFDGVICSNFLDVIPEKLSTLIIHEISRVLKTNGLFLLKLNFFLDDELINRLNMEKIEESTYAMKGVLRAYNLTTEQWINRLNNFELVEENSFQRAPNLPNDRILLFKKN